jgi:hypothetical protein
MKNYHPPHLAVIAMPPNIDYIVNIGEKFHPQRPD